MEVRRKDQSNILKNYNAFLDKIFLEYLDLRILGLEMNSLSLFKQRIIDKYTLFENNMVAVRESNLRDLNTSTLHTYEHQRIPKLHD